MANPWFRMYAEFATDAKVQMLSEAMQRRYLMLMCLRCSNTLVTLQDEEIAFQLRISGDDLAETKALFIKKGFIDSSWNVLNWEKRQFASDTSKDRVAKHRALQKKKQDSASNGVVTLQERKANVLDTDTDTEREAKASLSSAKPDAVPTCPHTELIDLFGQHLPMLSQPKPELWSGKKADAMRARWKWVLTAKKRSGQPYASSREEAIDFFDRFFAYVAKSDFLTGRDGKWPGCNLGWLMTEAKFSAVIEGNYDNKILEVA